MSSVTERIQQHLSAIESASNVQILYAVESGSRAWGFASEDSDYDVRFIFLRPKLDYLRTTPLRDVIELPIVDDLDINGWDTVKALNLFRASNPALLEWLHSPIVYRQQGALAERLREIAETYASPRRMSYHYLSMARRQFAEYIEGREEVALKKYLYVLRPVLCLTWIEQASGPPPTAIDATLAGISLPANVAQEIDSLLIQKRASREMGTVPPLKDLGDFCRTQIARFDSVIPGLPDPRIEAGVLDDLFHDLLGVINGS